MARRSRSKGRASHARRGHRMKAAGTLGRLGAATAVLAAEIWLVCAASIVLPTPATAQFWDYPFWGRRPAAPQREWSPWREQRSQPPVDASKAPPSRRQEGAPTKAVLVLGDSMADWLGFGLEDAFAETPEIGVIRKHRSFSGLIRPESRKERSEEHTSELQSRFDL